MSMRSLFRICMCCTVAIVAFALIDWFIMPGIANRVLHSVLSANPPLPVRIIAGTTGVLVATSVSVLWWGMMIECLVNKGLGALPKAGWLMLMVITNVVGALIYYFVRYQRQRILNAEI